MANTNVRHVGSIAGNLMLKHAHQDFPSDIFTLLETVGAQVCIVSTTGAQTLYSLQDFLQMSMDKKIILYINMPQLTNQHKFM